MNYNRKRLSRLIGKELEYTATISIRSGANDNICLKDIKYKGKMVSDHCWVLHWNLTEFENGTDIVFKATACTYKDRHNVRKTGLRDLHNVKRYNEDIHDELYGSHKYINARKR